jgi:hypothetical protein
MINLFSCCASRFMATAFNPFQINLFAFSPAGHFFPHA